MFSIDVRFDKLSYIYGFIYILIFLILLFSASLSNRLFDWVANPINIDLIIRLFIWIILSFPGYCNWWFCWLRFSVSDLRWNEPRRENGCGLPTIRLLLLLQVNSFLKRSYFFRWGFYTCRCYTVICISRCITAFGTWFSRCSCWLSLHRVLR